MFFGTFELLFWLASFWLLSKSDPHICIRLRLAFLAQVLTLVHDSGSQTGAYEIHPVMFEALCAAPTPVSNSVGLGRRARIIEHLQVMLTCWSQEQLWEVLITLVLYRRGPFMIPLDSIPLYKCTTVHMHNLPVMGVGVVSSVLLFQQYCVEHFLSSVTY